MSPSAPLLHLHSASPRTHSLHHIDPHSHLTHPPASIPRPLIYRAKFGAPSVWALDVFSLPHNAIRAECRDLYNILQSIHARSTYVPQHELTDFAHWWYAFDVFLVEYFDFEADLLFPAIFSSPAHLRRPHAHLPLDPEATAALRRELLTRKEPLLESLRQINGSFDLRLHVDASDVFHTIVDEVNEFVPKLMHYFHFQERHLPHLVSHLYPPDFKEAVVKKYLAYIRRGEAPHLNLPLLVRWMDAPVHDKWLRAHLRGMSRLFYPRWERKCRKGHLSIPLKFHRRLVRSVRNVAASRLRRRSEFAEDIEDISLGSFASMETSFKSMALPTGSKGVASRSAGVQQEKGIASRRRWR